MYFADAVTCDLMRTPNVVFGLLFFFIGAIGMWATLKVYLLSKQKAKHLKRDLSKISLLNKVRLFMAIVLVRPQIIRLSIIIPMMSFMALVTFLMGISLLVAYVFGYC